jgi:hypothetical protein
LEEILHHTLFEDNLQDRPTIFGITEPTPLPSTEKKPSNIAAVAPTAAQTNLPKTPKSKHQKSFADNLEDFFKDSLDEVFDGQIATIKRSIIRKTDRPSIGIDVLLQKTLVEEDEPTLNTQRLTFVLDAQKIERLKQIARQQKKQINEVIMELIEMYLEKRGA